MLPRVFFVPGGGGVTDSDQTHSPSSDLRNAIALIAHTLSEGLIWQHVQPNRTVESVAISYICPEGRMESQSSATGIDGGKTWTQVPGRLRHDSTI
jgi:hypothetical protein